MRTWLKTLPMLTALLALVVLRGSAQADFEWHGQLTSSQALEIRSVNGDIRALPSSTTDAQVTATKSANRSDPNSVRVEVVPHGGGVTICAVYPDVPGQ